MVGSLATICQNPGPNPSMLPVISVNTSHAGRLLRVRRFILLAHTGPPFCSASDRLLCIPGRAAGTGSCLRYT